LRAEAHLRASMAVFREHKGIDFCGYNLNSGVMNPFIENYDKE